MYCKSPKHFLKWEKSNTGVESGLTTSPMFIINFSIEFFTFYPSKSCETCVLHATPESNCSLFMFAVLHPQWFLIQSGFHTPLYESHCGHLPAVLYLWHVTSPVHIYIRLSRTEEARAAATGVQRKRGQTFITEVRRHAQSQIGIAVFPSNPAADPQGARRGTDTT